jgi:hypothetical protein
MVSLPFDSDDAEWEEFIDWLAEQPIPFLIWWDWLSACGDVADA